jgi:hypothetical protein
MAVALVIGLLLSVIGAGAHEQEGSCPMSNLPECCKKAQSSSPQAAMARLCCNLNCSEPSSGSGGSSSISPPQGSSADAMAVLLTAPVQRPLFLRHEFRTVGFSSSQPKYLQHLALLI